MMKHSQPSNLGHPQSAKCTNTQPILLRVNNELVDVHVVIAGLRILHPGHRDVEGVRAGPQVTVGGAYLPLGGWGVKVQETSMDSINGNGGFAAIVGFRVTIVHPAAPLANPRRSICRGW